MKIILIAVVVLAGMSSAGSASGVQNFVNAMVEPSEYFISPLQTQRIAGQFKLRVKDNSTINVTFVGSTHEWIKQGDAFAASDAELKFIYKYIFSSSYYAAQTLLIEQGTSAAENRLAGFVQKHGKDNPAIQSFLAYRMQNEDRTTELAATCVKALAAGARVVNMDLLYGEEFLEFYLNKYGADVAVKAACHACYSLGFSTEQALWTIEKIIRVKGLEQQFDRAAVRGLIKDYYPRLWADDLGTSDMGNEIAPDRLRNQYMAGKVYQQSSDVYIIAHTSHIVGILNALKGSISGFELYASELSVPAEAKLKTFSAAVRQEVNAEFRQRIADSIAPLTVQP